MLIPTILYKIFCQTFIPYLWLFLLGIYVRVYKTEINKVLGKYWIVFIVSAFISKSIQIFSFGIYGVIENTLLCAGIFGFIFSKHNSAIRINNDISYEIYIYHMIIINFLIEYSWVGDFTHIVIAFAITCLLSYFSYFTIGLYSNQNRIRIRGAN